MSSRSDAEPVELSPAVREVLRSLTLAEGKVRMPEDELRAFAGRFSGADDAGVEIVEQLVAAAVKLQRTGGEAAAEGVDALLVLAAVAAQSEGAARDAFQRAGGDSGRILALGREPARKLSTEPPPPGARSLLDVMLNSKGGSSS